MNKALETTVTQGLEQLSNGISFFFSPSNNSSSSSPSQEATSLMHIKILPLSILLGVFGIAATIIFFSLYKLNKSIGDIMDPNVEQKEDVKPEVKDVIVESTDQTPLVPTRNTKSYGTNTSVQ